MPQVILEKVLLTKQFLMRKSDEHYSPKGEIEAFKAEVSKEQGINQKAYRL